MPAETEWYYARDGKQRGPVPADAVSQLLHEGRLSAGDLVWSEGMANWQPAGSVQRFAAPRPPVGGVPPAHAPVAPPVINAPPPVSHAAYAAQPQNAQYGAQPAYGAQSYGSPYAAPAISYSRGTSSYNGLAVAALVFSFLMPLIGLILSIVALSGMKSSGNPEGRGLAKAGLFISIGWFALAILFFCIFVVAAIGMSPR